MCESQIGHALFADCSNSSAFTVPSWTAVADYMQTPVHLHSILSDDVHAHAVTLYPFPNMLHTTVPSAAPCIAHVPSMIIESSGCLRVPVPASDSITVEDVLYSHNAANTIAATDMLAVAQEPTADATRFPRILKKLDQVQSAAPTLTLGGAVPSMSTPIASTSASDVLQSDVAGQVWFKDAQSNISDTMSYHSLASNASSSQTSNTSYMYEDYSDDCESDGAESSILSLSTFSFAENGASTSRCKRVAHLRANAPQSNKRTCLRDAPTDATESASTTDDGAVSSDAELSMDLDADADAILSTMTCELFPEAHNSVMHALAVEREAKLFATPKSRRFQHQLTTIRTHMHDRAAATRAQKRRATVEANSSTDSNSMGESNSDVDSDSDSDSEVSTSSNSTLDTVQSTSQILTSASNSTSVLTSKVCTAPNSKSDVTASHDTISATTDSDNTSDVLSDDSTSTMSATPQFKPFNKRKMRSCVRSRANKLRIANDDSDNEYADRELSRDLAPRAHNVLFSATHDAELLAYVRKYGLSNWQVISNVWCANVSADGAWFNAKQCSDRWHNYVNPDLDLTPFTFEDEQHLLDIIERYTTAHNTTAISWIYVATHMPTLRSANMIKNWWYKHCRILRSRSVKTVKPYSTRLRQKPFESKRPLVTRNALTERIAHKRNFVTTQTHTLNDAMPASLTSLLDASVAEVTDRPEDMTDVPDVDVHATMVENELGDAPDTPLSSKALVGNVRQLTTRAHTLRSAALTAGKTLHALQNTENASSTDVCALVDSATKNDSRGTRATRTNFTTLRDLTVANVNSRSLHAVAPHLEVMPLLALQL